VTRWITPLLLLATALGAQDTRDWPAYGGNPEGTRFSPLTQINRSNVGQLKVAWQFVPDSIRSENRFQAQPIVVDGILYTVTPANTVVALDGATGRVKWTARSGSPTTVRGVSYWNNGKDPPRLLVAFGRFIYAIDVASGKEYLDFGVGGYIDLHRDLGRDTAQQSVSLTTPGVIYRDLYIVGGRTSESLPASYGDIRAYDVRTGRLRWTFHTIPRPGEFGYNTWPKNAWKYTGGANNWAGMAVDVKRGLVYVPTGSASADFYGANRVGDNLFANTLLALDANTGKRVWHFQGVKHDIWDRDFPSPPTLVTVVRNGKLIDAVSQTTKHGFVFVLDRTNGKPLFPIEYRRVPASTVEGEVTSRTQPFPLKPAPFARQRLTEDMLTHRTPLVHQWALEQFRTLRSGGLFLPFAVGKETVVFPGFDGGAEWGGSAFDPSTGVLYVNSNDIAWTTSMRRSRPDAEKAAAGPSSPYELKYNFTGYNKWYDPDGYPAVAPPWGTLNAINLNSGEYAWKIPLGEYPELAAQGVKDTGTENYGGPIVTAGGLVFIGATNYDRKFRAFDKDTGKLLWETMMPNSGNATPITYEVNGKQFVVIAAFGGYAGNRPKPSGGAFIAYSLP
jgi:quinoprotein glucose dehydrogenase